MTKDILTLPEMVTTSRLRLRLPVTSDAEAVYRSFGADIEVARWMPWLVHRNVSESEQYLRIRIQGREEGKCWHWLMTGLNTGDVVGMIGLGFEGHSAEVGFLVTRVGWGKGYATEALQVALDVALGQPGIYRVWGWCDRENVSSSRVMEKVGMEREGLMRRFGVLPGLSPEPRDAFVFAKAR